MLTLKISTYQGNEPYIFISYSHKDTDKVMPIVERLDKDGYRVWYDEGIRIAESFNSVIAERIGNCAFMVLLISDNYIVSEYCKKELNFADAEKKKLIGIYARGVKLTPRFKMLRANIQGIDEPYSYDDEFFEKLYNAEDISKCLKVGNTNTTQKIKYDNGDVYEGEMLNGMKNGQGKMIYANGNIYEGEWQDDFQNGRGKMTYANGNVYEGEWKNFIDTQFKSFINGITFEREIREIFPHGNGKMTYADGNIYEGEWKNGKKNGYGKYIYMERVVYEGEWKDDKMNGRFKITTYDGIVSECEYKEGKMYGREKVIYTNGIIEEADWENGKKIGKSKITYGDGTIEYID